MVKDIVPLLPQGGSMYVEPFVGRGNIGLNVMLYNFEFERFHLNDISTARFLRNLRDHGDTVRLSRNPRTAYYKHWNEQKSGIYTPEGVLNETRNCFAAGTYGDSGPVHLDRIRDAKRYKLDLQRSCELLRSNKVTITAKDWKELYLGNLPKDAFVFLDPPYFGADVRSYTSEGFDYTAMVKLLEGARFRWMLTEYEQSFYNKAFGKPIFRKKTVCQLSRDGSERVECIYTNF